MSRKTGLALVATVLGLILCASAIWSMDAESFLNCKFPTASIWSQNGQFIAFQMGSAAGSDIFLFSIQQRAILKLVKNIPPYRYEKEHPDIRWGVDGKSILYTIGREYFSVPIEGGNPKLVMSGLLLGEMVTLSPDQKRISFIRDGDIWVQDVPSGSPMRLTQGESFLGYDGEVFSRLSQWPQWSPDSKKIAFLSLMQTGYRVGIVSIDDRKITWIVPEKDIWGMTVVDWAPDSMKLAISRLSEDLRTKELVIADSATANVYRIWQDNDDKWVDHHIVPGFFVAWSRKGDSIAFLSNRGGWRHLYVSDYEGRQLKQLTKGEYHVYKCAWADEDSEILAVTSKDHLQQKHLWSYSLKDGQERRLGDRPGIYALLCMSPDHRRLAFSYSGPDDPLSLWVSTTSGNPGPVSFYSLRPEGITDEDVALLEEVSFESSDGTKIPAVLIKSKKFDRSSKSPALIHMYGGWKQKATLGWELGIQSAFFNYLAQKGFLVLIVDPRGSEGYSDNYLKGIYHEAGGKQVDDLIAAAKYLGHLGYVDAAAISIFGWSYGGYLAVQTVVEASDVFAAGIAVAGVFDWENYGGKYSPYHQLRFGSPDDCPNRIRERSPVNNIDKLKKPILLFHGTGDFNVPIGSSETLVNILLKKKKDFDYVVYPGEPHVWTKPEVWRDFIRRTELFLDGLRKRQ